MIDRLENRYVVNENTGCWEWSLYKSNGYGRITVNKEILYAHRYSYIAHKGQIPEGLVVMHTCDNPCCINPDHLVAATQKANIADMMKKKRKDFALGEANHASRFTDYEVEAMRLLHEKYNLPSYLCAKAFGISKNHVYSILKYKKRISCPINLQNKTLLLKSLAN